MPGLPLLPGGQSGVVAARGSVGVGAITQLLLETEGTESPASLSIARVSAPC